MNYMRKTPVADQSSWKARDIRDHSEQWVHVLSADDVREIEAALEHVNAKGLAAEKITRNDFPLPSVQKLLSIILKQVHDDFSFVRCTVCLVKNTLKTTPLKYSGGSARIWARLNRKTRTAIWLGMLLIWAGDSVKTEYAAIRPIKS